jgi:uncharacterized damage-inducible protein DinB
MNCISWNVGHLTWQEQRYWLTRGQGKTPLPDVQTQFAYGAPASAPSLAAMWEVWRTVTAAADPWLDALTTAALLERHPFSPGSKNTYTFGNLLQRMIYHYWYHTGENMAIRQLLGHRDLPEFVGNIDDEAPYTPE